MRRHRTSLPLLLAVLAWIAPPSAARADLIPAGAPLTPERTDVQFGRAIALAGDGDTALVDGPQAGASWVFARSGPTWRRQAILTPPGRVPTTEKTSVALSADGNTALIGQGASGTAWVFVRRGTAWSLETTLAPYAPEGPMYSWFGSDVALSSSGDLAAVTAPTYGRALVFERTGGAWAQAAALGDGGSWPSARSGAADVAVSGDGNLVLTGGDETESWVRGPSGWQPLPGLPAASAIAVSRDGGTALLGSWGGVQPAVRAYTRADGGWREQAEIVPSDPSATAVFGQSVALSGDGSRALVGGARQFGDLGGAWLFARRDGVWSQEQPMISPPGPPALSFGLSVALSADGRGALVGGGQDRTWAYGEGSVVGGVTPASGSRSGGTRVTITGRGFADVRGVFFGTVRAASYRVMSPTRIVATTPAAPAGTRHVTVVTERAVSATSSADRFTWRVPAVSLGARGLRVRVERPLLRVTCRRSVCAGTVRLVRGRVLLARGSFALGEGRSATVRLRPTNAGRRARAGGRARLVVAVRGAPVVRRTVALR